jgi:hypothetical protein
VPQGVAQCDDAMTLETAKRIARLQRELLDAYDVEREQRDPGALFFPSAEGMSWWPGRAGRPDPEADDAWLDRRIAALERAVAARETG